jgi:hypothetical protein
MRNTKLTRSKIFSFFASIFVLLNLTSCENFFTDNGLDEKIRAAIDYANAPTSSFWITADASSGTITPVGKITYKPTDYQNIKFKVKPDYEFLRWNFRYEEIQSGEKYTREITNQNWWKDYIEIVNEEISEPSTSGEITYTLQIKFIKAEENMLIEPICSLKPTLKSWSGQLGEIQSRNGSLSFVFNTKIDLDKSIYFSDKEISELGIVTPLYNGLDKIYGYQKGDEVYFKNIEIKYKNRNINSSYKDFRYKDDTNTLIISSDSSHPFDIVGDFADIEVIFKSGIKSTDGASMPESKASININKYSDDRSVITVATNTAKNPETVAPVTQTLYLQEQKNATFTESDKSQFLYWEVTSASEYPDSKDKVYVEVDEENPLKITYWGMQKIDSTEEVTISAVYEPRPSYEWPFSSSAVYPKDSDIKIKFDKEINLDSFKEGYKIAIDGSSVKANFDEPILDTDNKTVIIRSNKNNRLSISGTKIVTVTIPEDLYYSVTENDGQTYKVYLGKEHNPSYTINAETAEKAYVKFIVPSEAGELVKFDSTGVKTLNIGDALTLTYKEKTGYQFIEWQIEGNTDNAVEVVKSETDSLTYTFNAKKLVGSAAEPVTITAVAKERLKIVKVTPATTGSEAVAQDTGIEIYFNHEPTLELCKQKLSIKCNANVKDCFPVSRWTLTPETLDGKTVYHLHIPADKANRIGVTGTAVVELSLDANFYYSDAGTPVYIGGEGWTYEYKVNEETTDKAYLTLNTETAKGALRNAFEASGYSIGRKINVTFIPSDDYEFLYWNTIDDTAISIEDKFQKNTNITILDTGNISITAECAPKLKVNSWSISSTPDSNSNYPKDSDITIQFNAELSSRINLKNFISVLCGGKDVYSNYDQILNENTLTLKAKQENRIQLSAPQDLKISIASDLYYEYTDDVVSSKIYMNAPDDKTYKLNTTTCDKATIQLLPVTEGDVKNAKITDLYNTEKSYAPTEYSKDETFQIKADVEPDYEFVSWNVTDTAGNLSVTGINDKTLFVTVTGSESGTSTITPNIVPKLKVNGFDISSSADSNNSYSKDSSYCIILNEMPSVSSIALRNYVSIKLGEEDVSTGYFTYILANTVDGPSLIISNAANNRLNVTTTSSQPYQELTITIDNSLYYAQGDKNIPMKEPYVKTVRINETTGNKAKIQLQGPLPSVAGTVDYNPNLYQKSLDETFTINFTPNTGYEFIKWDIIYSNQTAASNVTYSDITKTALTVTVKDCKNGIVNIKPVVEQNLYVTNMAYSYSTSATLSFTQTSSTGTYEKDSVLAIVFNRPLPRIRPEDYVTLKIGDVDVTSKYTMYIGGTDGKMIILQPDLTNLPEISSSATSVNLSITVDKSLYWEFSEDSINKNIYMADDAIQTVKLLPNTNLKTYIRGYCETAKGTLTVKDEAGDICNVTNSSAYGIDRKLTFSVVPKSGYIFKGWKFENYSSTSQATVSFSGNTVSGNAIETTVTMLTPSANQNDYIKIYPMLVQEFAVSTFKVGDASFNSSNTYAKDSTYIVTFNKPLEFTVANFEKFVSIRMGASEDNSTDVTSKFYFATVSGSTTSMAIGANERLSFTDDTTNLYLTIDNSIYYTNTDYSAIGYQEKIYLSQPYTQTIKINKTTNAKVEFNFTPATTYGTMKVTLDSATTIITTSTNKQYNLDEAVTIEFTPSDDYQFLGWDVSGTATTSWYNISDITASSTTITGLASNYIANQTTQKTIIVSPKCVPKLKVTKVEIYNDSSTTLPNSSTFPKDSDIKITFNQTPYSLSVIRNNISLICNGQDVLGYFSPALSGSVLTLTASSTNRIPVTSNSTVYLTIKEGAYYRTDSTDIKMKAQQDYSYTINYTTRGRASVNVTCNSAYGTIKNADGTNFTTGTKSYSKDEILNLQFIPNDDYEFVYWQVTTPSSYPNCVNNVSVKYLESPNTSIEIKNSYTGTVTISPYTVEKLKITSVKVNGSDYYPVTLYPKDSTVVLNFNKKINTSNLYNYIKLYFKNKDTGSVVSASDTSKYFTFAETGTSSSTVTFTPVSGKFLDVQTSDLVFISVAKNIYYNVTYTPLGSSTEKTKSIYLNEKYDEYYQVTNESKNTFELFKKATGGNDDEENTQAANLITISPYRENGLYYYGETITVKFPRTTQNYYDVNSSGTSTDLKKAGWELQKDSTSSTITGKINTTSTTTDYYTASFQVYTTSSGKANICFSVKTQPQIKAITPVTTNEIKTYPCDTPITIQFTHKINKSTVSFQSGTTGNLRVVRATDASGNLTAGIEDITNYYDICSTEYSFVNEDVVATTIIEGENDTLIIRPKTALLDLFALIGKEEETIYVLALQSGTTIKNTDGVNLFAKIPSAMSDKLSSVTISNKTYCCIPLKIDSSVSSPRLRIKEEKVYFTMNPGGGSIKKDTQLKTTSDITSTSNSSAVFNSPNISYTMKLNRSVMGNWSETDFAWAGTVEIAVTKVASYIKKTPSGGTTTTSVSSSNDIISPVSKMVVQNWVGSWSNSTIPPVVSCSGAFDLQALGFEANKSETLANGTVTVTSPILRLDFTITLPVFQVPYKTTYYVMYGSK